MKEIALIGVNSQVYADVLSALLRAGMSVNAMSDNPERLMLDDTRLTSTLYDYADKDALLRSLEDYRTAVIAYSDDLTDSHATGIALDYFASTIEAARRAGVKKVVVVGSPQSQEFFVSHLRRVEGIDSKFISTEGDFPTHTVEAL